MSVLLRIIKPGILLLCFLLPVQAATWWVRTDGATSPTCNGQVDAPASAAPNCAFNSPQSAFNIATWGDTIKLKTAQSWDAPGTTSPFVLPNKGTPPTGTDADYIKVETSTLNSLPAGRVFDASNMARIRALGTSGAILVAAGASYWKFSGIEITNLSSGTAGEHAFTLVEIGASGTANHFWFDRVYCHPQEDGTLNYFRTVTRCFGVNNTDVFKLTNSRVTGFLGRYAHDHNDLIDSETFSTAAVGTNYLISNNTLQAYFNTFFLGGGSIAPTTNTAIVQSLPTPSLTSCALSSVNNLALGDYISFPQPGGARNANARITNIAGNTITYTTLDLYNESLGQRIPATAPAAGAVARWGPNSNSPIDQIVMSQNTFSQDTAYCAWEYGQTGGVRMPKGFFEIKWVDHMLMEGNTFTGWPSWIAINAVNQTGNSPWLTVRNFTFRNNWIQQQAIGVLNISFGNPLGQADWHMTQQGANIEFSNNLFVNASPFPIDLGGWGPRVMQGGWGPINLTINHNTFANNALETVATWAASGPVTGFVFTNNIFWQNQYGIGCSYAGQTFADCWPGWIDTKNAVINASGNNNATEQLKFPGSYIVTNSTNPVSWVGPLSNSTTLGWKLTSGSPYHNAASDGSDVGVNIDVLNAALGPTPTPTPTPTPSNPGGVTINGKAVTSGKVVSQ